MIHRLWIVGGVHFVPDASRKRVEREASSGTTVWRRWIGIGRPIIN